MDRRREYRRRRRRGGAAASGLVSSWPLSADFTDATGGNDLTAQAGAAITGGAAVFEAANSEYASCPDAAELRGADHFTVCGWVKFATVGNQGVAGNVSTGSPDLEGFGLRTATVKGVGTTFVFRVVATALSTAQATDATVLAADTWYAVFAWVAPTEVGVQVDGNAAATSPWLFDVPDTERTGFRLGNDHGADYLNGSLGKWRFYSRVLSESERAAFFAEGPPA
jgi:hypothetical protein